LESFTVSLSRILLPLTRLNTAISVPQVVNAEAASFAFSVEDTSWLGTPRMTQLDNLGEVLVVGAGIV